MRGRVVTPGLDTSCPPCIGNCDQGRACPAREAKPLPHGFAIAAMLVGFILGGVSALTALALGWGLWP